MEKVFRRQHQVRDSAATVLRSGFDVPVDLIRFSQTEAAAGATVSAALGTPELTPFQRVELYVRIELAEGLHVYGREAPDGYVPTAVTVTGPEALRLEEARFPATKPFRVGHRRAVPGARRRDRDRGPARLLAPRGKNAPIDVEVRYQACDDRECYLPQTERLHLEAPLGRLVLPQRR